MEITWDHPASKQPENGYKLVFAPFKDIVDQKPWSVNVLSTDNSVSISLWCITSRLCVVVHDITIGSGQFKNFVHANFRFDSTFMLR